MFYLPLILGCNEPEQSIVMPDPTGSYYSTLNAQVTAPILHFTPLCRAWAEAWFGQLSSVTLQAIAIAVQAEAALLTV